MLCRESLPVGISRACSCSAGVPEALSCFGLGSVWSLAPSALYNRSTCGYKDVTRPEAGTGHKGVSPVWRALAVYTLLKLADCLAVSAASEAVLGRPVAQGFLQLREQAPTADVMSFLWKSSHAPYSKLP